MFRIKSIFCVALCALFFVSCSQTYENYTIDLDRSNEVVVDAVVWPLQKFEITEKTNTAQGDTAALKYITIEATDASFPYPKVLRFDVYINTELKEAETTTSLSDNGLIGAALMTEFDIDYENYFYVFTLQASEPFPPTLTITNYDKARGLISGRLSGALYEKHSTAIKHIMSVSFQNLRIINHKNQ